MQMINAELLAKYMQHVRQCEGSTCVHRIDDGISEVEFTEAEQVLLTMLDAAIRKDPWGKDPWSN